MPGLQVADVFLPSRNKPRHRTPLMDKATIHFDKWPQILMIARHGYSKANKRKDDAKAAGVEPSWTERERDQDSPLTEIGHQQAFDLGVMTSEIEFPEVIITSPYLRAKQTTE